MQIPLRIAYLPSPAMLAAAREHQQLIADEALATTIEATDALRGASATTLDGHGLVIKFEKA